MKRLLKLAEYGFAVLYLLHYSGAPLTLILSGGANEGDIDRGVASIDNSLVLALFFVNYIVTFLLLVLRWKKVVYVLSKDRYMWVLAGFVILSIFWTANPSKSLSRIIAFTGTTMFGLYLATRYTMKEQLKLLAWTFGITIVSSFLFAVALPKFGIMGGIHAGKWRGIYNHKNVLGKYMALSTIIFCILATSLRKNRWLLWLGCSLSILLLLLSTAKTSLINCIIVLAAFPAFGILKWNLDFKIPGLLGIVAIGSSLYFWLTSNAEAFLGSLGKDTTLTGRADLWPLVLHQIWTRPWFGYGFGGFWNGLEGESSELWYASGWTPPNAHNGFLDVWLQLGIFGLFLLAITFFATAIRALLYMPYAEKNTWLWPLLYLTYLVLASLGESSLMVQNDLFWVIYVAIVYTLIITDKNTKFRNY
ncbi:MAG: O-antigen ligase family protein [Fischerella sp. CENA71]|nr:O-antigen ligase family protein [Fischerella sp. CENA71]